HAISLYNRLNNTRPAHRTNEPTAAPILTATTGPLPLRSTALLDIPPHSRNLPSIPTRRSSDLGNGGIFRTGSGASLNNSGTWLEIGRLDARTNDAFCGAVSSFNSTCTYTKSGAGAGTTTSSIGFNNTSSCVGTGAGNVNAGSLA